MIDRQPFAGMATRPRSVRRPQRPLRERGCRSYERRAIWPGRFWRLKEEPADDLRRQESPVVSGHSPVGGTGLEPMTSCL